ncbi:MAG: acetate--CoA ligase family protein [Candidatus Cyclobacteriaceae bacterium M2_1C_046]
MKQSLNALFNPGSIAVIGASRDENNVGRGLIKNLMESDYQGDIFPVNPKADAIMDLKCYSSVSDIDQKVDLAFIVIPRDAVVDVMKECAEKEIKAVVVISAGFKETDEKGEKLENELAQIAKDNDMAVLGPNCLGVINTHEKVKMNGTFAKTTPGKGNISFISQSGAVGVYALEYADKHHIDFAKFASLGNKAVSTENDVLEAYSEDDQTKVILSYLEDLDDAKSFLDLASELKKKKENKPLVVLKGGGSESGKRAAESHTGALTESDEVLDHLFEQYGIIRVPNLESMFYTARLFSSEQIPEGNRLCILTNAGGPGIITADAAEKAGFKVPALSDDLQEKMKEDLPPTVSFNNPVDLAGDATAERYETALKELIKSEEIDIILTLCTPQMMTDMEEIAGTIGKYAQEARDNKKVLLSVFADFDPKSKVRDILSEKNIPYYQFGNNAVKAGAAALKYHRFKKRPDEKPASYEVTKDNAREILKRAEERENKFVTEPEAYQIFRDYGMKVAEYKVIKEKEEAKHAGQELVFPLVAKVISKQVIHKTDAGGVVTDIRREQELVDAYKEIHNEVGSEKDDAEIDGILLQKMVGKGTEFILGARYNQKYGHILMFGLGGVFVEMLKDVTFRRAPITKHDALEMIEGIRTKKVFEGVRNNPAPNKEALAEYLQRLSQLVTDFPQIKEIDLNPVFATDEEAVLADARIIIRDN